MGDGLKFGLKKYWGIKQNSSSPQNSSRRNEAQQGIANHNWKKGKNKSCTTKQKGNSKDFHQLMGCQKQEVDEQQKGQHKHNLPTCSQKQSPSVFVIPNGSTNPELPPDMVEPTKRDNWICEIHVRRMAQDIAGCQYNFFTRIDSR